MEKVHFHEIGAVDSIVDIVVDNGLHLHLADTEGELVTPTGAAIIATIRTSDKLPEQFLIQKIGVGAGKRNYERINILRAMIIKEDSIGGNNI